MNMDTHVTSNSGADELRLSKTTGILHNMRICIPSSSHYVIPSQNLKPPSLYFTFKICLCHQSVTPFLSGVSSPKKNPGSTPVMWVQGYPNHNANDWQVHALDKTMFRNAMRDN